MARTTRSSTTTRLKASVSPARRGAARADSQTAQPRNATAVEIPHERIAQRAYEKFLARGCRHGDDLKDWFEAERELRAELQKN
jgi:hypothetical protein